MTRLAIAFLGIVGVFSAHAAIIRGTVIEKRTGYVLSRATVTLEPVASAGQQIRTIHTGENGQFTFDALSAGEYLIKASRRGFMPIQYGQKRWDSAGTAIVLAGNDIVSVQLPMLRYGAVVGTVLDSNEVGIADQDVAAYSDTQPPSFVAHGKSDDRGVFRIGGLEPGNYLVRTTGNKDEEISYLPTFSRQTLRVEEALPVVVYADEDTKDGDVRPIQGSLFELSGYIPLPAPPNFSVTVTLASDLGRTTTGGPAYHFPALAPGRYELYAEARENPPGTRILAGYTELTIGRNITGFALPMNEVRGMPFVLDGAGPGVSASALVRRKDYAGTGPVQTVALNAMTSVMLLPGRWEVEVIGPPGYYVSRFVSSRNNPKRPDGWNEVMAIPAGRVNVTLSSGPSAVHGTVRSSGSPARGAPVFLEGWDPVTRNRLVDLRETRSDMNGNYRFEGLAPGDYRVLSTFDYAAPSPQVFDTDGASTIRLEAAGDLQVDLLLSGEP